MAHLNLLPRPVISVPGAPGIWVVNDALGFHLVAPRMKSVRSTASAPVHVDLGVLVDLSTRVLTLVTTSSKERCPEVEIAEARNRLFTGDLAAFNPPIGFISAIGSKVPDAKIDAYWRIADALHGKFSEEGLDFLGRLSTEKSRSFPEVPHIEARIVENRYLVHKAGDLNSPAVLSAEDLVRFSCAVLADRELSNAFEDQWFPALMLAAGSPRQKEIVQPPSNEARQVNLSSAELPALTHEIIVDPIRVGFAVKGVV